MGERLASCSAPFYFAFHMSFLLKCQRHALTYCLTLDIAVPVSQSALPFHSIQMSHHKVLSKCSATKFAGLGIRTGTPLTPYVFFLSASACAWHCVCCLCAVSSLQFLMFIMVHWNSVLTMWPQGHCYVILQLVMWPCTKKY